MSIDLLSFMPLAKLKSAGNNYNIVCGKLTEQGSPHDFSALSYNKVKNHWIRGHKTVVFCALVFFLKLPVACNETSCLTVSIDDNHVCLRIPFWTNR